MKKLIIYILPLILLVNTFNSLQAQFYNGHQMSFGKNRIQYNNMYWGYFRFERFDTYFHENGELFARYTAEIAQKQLENFERTLGHTLEKRIIFIIYNRHSNFKQSNIGLVTGSEQNIGGTTQIIDNKVFLFYQGNHVDFENQISAAIAEVILSEMLYGPKTSQKVTNNVLLTLPEWYKSGLISYLSRKWDYKTENKLKDGFTSKKFKRFNQLRGEDAQIAGHSIWQYVADIYGTEVIPNIIYLTRINKNPDFGFKFAIGSSVKELSTDWMYYFTQKFTENDKNTVLPDTGFVLKKPKKNTVYQQIKICPDGKNVAFVTNQLGKYKIYIKNTDKNKIKRIYKRESKLEQITDYSYPVLGWHPTGKILAFAVEQKGQTIMYNYWPETKEFKSRVLPFEKILDFDYSDDGFKMVISAVFQGRTDLFLFNISSGTTEALTKDLADDFNPQFIDNSRKIIFSSNRTSDTLKSEKDEIYPLALNTDLYVLDYRSKSKILTNITNTTHSSEFSPKQIKKNTYIYLSDENGIMNRHIASYDSTVSFVDTIVHYRFFSNKYPLTNYSRNIEYYDINVKNGQVADLYLKKGKYYINLQKLNTTKNTRGNYTTTEFKKKFDNYLIKKDSLQKIDKEKETKQAKIRDSIKNLKIPPVKNTIYSDTSVVDINNYLFEAEKINSPYYLILKQDSILKQNALADSFKFPKQRLYYTSFYINNIVSQIDLGNLNESYQPFTGSAFYFNPGLNLFNKVGVSDLFEDYRFVGGMRVAGNFDSFEYLASFENLKKQLDKQLLFHRQSITNTYPEINLKYKIYTHEIFYILRYPFSQVFAVKGTLGARYDELVIKSTDKQTLAEKNQYMGFTSAKVELIFDNSVSLGLNLYEGIRAKVFGEFYQQAEGVYTNFAVIGFDFRKYIRIHRNMIFATRMAASTSFGKSKLIYYLGGVDNWTPFSPTTQLFDPTTPIDPNQTYVYQAVATNLRGFSQNIRNGNSFMLINNEIRLPIFSYLFNKPINNDFINNFQVIGFFDAGTAWTGANPYLNKHLYNDEVIVNGPITVIIDKDRPPFVAGYGYGVRSKLFGYFIRLDWAWGIEGKAILPKMFYFSLNLDF